jgi:putative CocE/NonD family hydrolase
LLVHTQQSALQLLRTVLLGDRKLQPVFAHLPLSEADRLAVGRQVGWWQDWLQHTAPGDPWWQPLDHWAATSSVAAPALLFGGWYDIFLPDILDQYSALRRAGRAPRLVVGPWIHASLGLMADSTREGLAWFRAHLRGDRSGLSEKPVRLYVMGANEWREYDEWPPARPRPQRWHLHAGGVLARTAPAPSEPDRYRYNPSNPTPGVGGPLLTNQAGPRDNRSVEARPDVCTYTSAPLAADLEIIGPVPVELFARSSREHTDFFVRLCDVHPSGKSINITDQLVRVVPGQPAREPDGGLSLCFELWPTAHRFRRGHSLRVQVSSGAHPRLARNTGTGEPLSTATQLVAADQAIYHDPPHPSALLLPAVG